MSIQLKHQITSSISECLRGYQEGRNLDFLLYRIECILCLVNEALSSGNHDNLLDVCDIIHQAYVILKESVEHEIPFDNVHNLFVFRNASTLRIPESGMLMHCETGFLRFYILGTNTCFQFTNVTLSELL